MVIINKKAFMTKQMIQMKNDTKKLLTTGQGEDYTNGC